MDHTLVGDASMEASLCYTQRQDMASRHCSSPHLELAGGRPVLAVAAQHISTTSHQDLAGLQYSNAALRVDNANICTH